MSAFGTKRTFKPPLRMSAFGGKADIPDARSNVCLSLKTGFPGMRHILSKFGIKSFARCRAGLDLLSPAQPSPSRYDGLIPIDPSNPREIDGKF